MRPEYGDGPTRAAWYGLANILGLVVGGALYNVPREKSDLGPAASIAVPILGWWIGMFFALAVTWFVGKILGWV